MTVAIFTPTRHPGIAVSAYSVLRQTYKDVVWLVADQLDRWELIEDACPDLRHEVAFLPIDEDKPGNLARCDNWALTMAREMQVDLLVFLQDFIWMPPNGVQMFLDDAKAHPFALLTGAVEAATGPVRFEDAPKPDWDIFMPGVVEEKPYGPYTPDTRVQMGLKGGRLSNHAWEVNYGALPHALINAGIDFDEDYDYGTQWENTQFSFDVARKMPSGMGYVWWNPNNKAVGMPHRDYFPSTHEGEMTVRNNERFFSKNPDLIPSGP